MKGFSSLRGRMFLTSAVLAVLSIGVALYLVNARVTSEAEKQLQREIVATGALVDNLRSTRTQTFTTMARLIADIPKLRAAVDTNDPPTVQDIAEGYQRQLGSNLLLVTNKTGGVLATVGVNPRTSLIIASQPPIRRALAGHESDSLLPQPNGILQLVSVPIAIGRDAPEILGTLSVGFLLDNALAVQLKQVTGSDIAFGSDGQILAATLPPADRGPLADLLTAAGISHVRLGNQDYVVLPRPLAADTDAAALAGPRALILRSRTEQLRFLQAIHTGLGVTTVVAVILAIVLSFAVARTITRPLATITGVMREVAATGDLTRKIALSEGRRWEDEDAQLLASTFNTLTDSIARFQREVAQRERLSSLGRLSTVIAHEVRNPLMIIKASLHALRQPDLTPAAMHEAVGDIDEEVARLNRLVNEVLDFARPIRFEPTTTDLNALCRESAAASATAAPAVAVDLALDSALPRVTTDPERLRIALVNMLVNARHAVAARVPAAAAAGSAGGRTLGDPPERTVDAPARTAPPLITVTTRAVRGRAVITIADRGVGIDATDLPRVFDPYFTTKRGGTGLGLAIAKNIVEGLGGSIAVSSEPGRGTEIRLDLPVDYR